MMRVNEKKRERYGRIRVISSASWVCSIPELGEQQSRNVPRSEQRHKQSKRKGKKQQEKEHVTLHCSSLNVKVDSLIKYFSKPPPKKSSIIKV